MTNSQNHLGTSLPARPTSATATTDSGRGGAAALRCHYGGCRRAGAAAPGTAAVLRDSELPVRVNRATRAATASHGGSPGHGCGQRRACDSQSGEEGLGGTVHSRPEHARAELELEDPAFQVDSAPSHWHRATGSGPAPRLVTLRLAF